MVRSAPIDRATSMGRGSTTPPSRRRLRPETIGVKMPGMDTLARIASRRLPLRNTTARPVSKSEATMPRGRGRSSMRASFGM